MLTRLRVRNFKCLQDVDVPLEPLTALIGPNDSGKTSILQALNLLGILAAHDQVLGAAPRPFTVPPAEVPDGYRLDQLIWRRDRGRSFEWEVEGELESLPFRYQLTVSPTNLLSTSRAEVAGQLTAEQGAALRQALTVSNPYFLLPEALKRGAPPAPDPVLSPSGDNLAAVLDALITGYDRETALGLERSIRENIPTLRGLSLRTLPASSPARLSDKEKLLAFFQNLVSVAEPQLGDGRGPVKVIDFVLAGSERPPVVIPAAQASDGALLITAFLALAYGDSPPILLIEEPENGFHPSRLQAVLELLRRITRGEVGPRPRQIILTSHSPILLNFLRPEEVRIVHRDPTEGTKVTPLTQAPRIDELLKEFGIGELWYHLREEGLLRGDAP